jgi:MYXO-CTERM domain-containing protein
MYLCVAMSPKNTPCSPLATSVAVSPLGRALAASLLALAVLLWGGRALAGGGPGSFAIKTPSVDEKTGEWHIKVRIDLPRSPPMMHTPMRFTFSKEVVDERAIMSKGAEPEHHRMVIDTPPKQVVSMDVDFADASGKVFKSTYFEFDLQRRNGYFEAGEYLCSLSGPDGEVGVAQKLTLKGDNPPVYRGAMDFSSDSKGNKKGVKIQDVSSGIDGGSQVAQNDTSGPSAAPMSTDVTPSGDAPDMVPKGAYNKTSEEEAVQDHPKGCGCVAAGLEGGSAAAGVVLLGLALALARRRRVV